MSRPRIKNRCRLNSGFILNSRMGRWLPSSSACASAVRRGWLLLLTLMLAGCAGTGGRTSGARVEQLDLLLTPMALDLDGQPGLDGFGARIYASNRRSSSGVVISDGRLEIQLFDGVIPAEEAAAAKPLRVWSYEPPGLKPFAQTTSIGTGYRFGLSWGAQRPKGPRITIVARYIGPGGGVVTSAPGSIPLTTR
jgi:hypothetical protein